jgi:alginate O-acetyltransferase complex protein AlgI
MVLLLHYQVYLIKQNLKNLILVISSLFFYAWGETTYLAILLLSIIINFALAIGIEKQHGKVKGITSKLFLVIGLAFNVGLLAVFKYLTVILGYIDSILSIVHVDTISLAPIHAPLGISFFTFMVISYIIDVYRKNVKAATNLIDFTLYVSFFPKLIAGPIVRYRDMAGELESRTIDVELVASGVRRFIIGLGKKVLISGSISQVADNIFAVDMNNMTSWLAWLGIVCYALQIYFDFSGYSDMAIGLGRIFGFHFLENFNYPYVAKSIKEFWQRWHISLTTWLRDYLFLPVAYSTSRKLSKETYVGIRTDKIIYFIATIITFLICGIWHGAAWKFAVWGLWYGVFLVLEHLGFGRFLKKLWEPLRHGYVILVILIGWCFFRSDTLIYAFGYIKSMFGFANGIASEFPVRGYLNNVVIVALLFGVVFSTPIAPYLAKIYINYLERLKSLGKNTTRISGFITAGYFIVLALILFTSTISLAKGTHNPFIYFKF